MPSPYTDAGTFSRAKIRKTVFVNAVTYVQLRPPKGGRSYMFIQNVSANTVYLEEDTLPTPGNALEIPAGGTLEYSSNQGDSVPQGNCWLLGDAADPTQQTVKVKEG